MDVLFGIPLERPPASAAGLFTIDLRPLSSIVPLAAVRSIWARAPTSSPSSSGCRVDIRAEVGWPSFLAEPGREKPFPGLPLVWKMKKILKLSFSGLWLGGQQVKEDHSMGKGLPRTEVEFLLLTLLPRIWFSAFTKFILDVAEIYQQNWLEETDGRLENLYQTHLYLAGTPKKLYGANPTKPLLLILELSVLQWFNLRLCIILYKLFCFTAHWFKCDLIELLGKMRRTQAHRCSQFWPTSKGPSEEV